MWSGSWTIRKWQREIRHRVQSLVEGATDPWDQVKEFEIDIPESEEDEFIDEETADGGCWRSDRVHVHDKKAGNGNDSKGGLFVWTFVDLTELKRFSVYLKFTEFFWQKLERRKILDSINVFLWFLPLISSTRSRPTHEKSEGCFITAGPGVKTTKVLLTQRCVDFWNNIKLEPVSWIWTKKIQSPWRDYQYVNILVDFERFARAICDPIISLSRNTSFFCFNNTPATGKKTVSGSQMIKSVRFEFHYMTSHRSRQKPRPLLTFTYIDDKCTLFLTWFKVAYFSFERVKRSNSCPFWEMFQVDDFPFSNYCLL